MSLLMDRQCNAHLLTPWQTSGAGDRAELRLVQVGDDQRARDSDSVRGLSIAICTKDRVDYLRRCITSICRTPPEGIPFEVLIVDDGHLDAAVVQWAHACVSQVGGAVRLVDKSHQPGLHTSRLIALGMAQYDIVTFLDDDVEVLPGYFRELQRVFDSAPGVTGLGGVNINGLPTPKWRRLFEYLFLLRSVSIGRLTASGFNRSHDEWASRSESFSTDFLLGCNMSLKREAVRDIRQASYFDGYSLGEDIYLSLWAARRGTLMINPQMRVLHHFAPGGRPDQTKLWRETIHNCWEMSGLRRRDFLHGAAFFWSVIGLVAGHVIVFVGTAIQGDWPACKGRMGALYGISQGTWTIISGARRAQAG